MLHRSFSTLLVPTLLSLRAAGTDGAEVTEGTSRRRGAEGTVVTEVGAGLTVSFTQPNPTHE